MSEHPNATRIRALDNQVVLRVRIEDGRVREIWEYVWDLDHVEAFWA